ncbi:hypothetical protein PsYK624_081220 [Phanerochaete sordida]|uniref:Nephrocystin 3-like N-terminal domain-containing protein n=1 Tax=Phanerochaete sordida TaxID=48140 RepID=A0A9P3GC54_9APHY|nr:hypothetical protein PsYK624_081220 [Phanerochaete sordida]
MLGRDDYGAILEEIKRMSDSALDSFERRDSKDIAEIISDIKDATEMQQQYQVAEGISEFLQFVLDDYAGERLLEKQKTWSAPSIAPDVREELEDWIFGGPARERIYFLSGEAGLGKSRIAYQQCLKLQSMQEPLPLLGASFFFEQGHKFLDSPLSLLACLAYQLQPQLGPQTSSNIRAIIASGGKQLERLMLLLRRALRGVGTSRSQLQPIVLVIDGFNECKEREQIPFLLRHLVTLVRDFHWLRLIITSRPHPPVMTVLAHASVNDIVYQRHMEPEDGSSAVQRYLEHAIPKIPTYADFPRRHPEALRHLTTSAGDRFDIAHFALEYLDSPHNKRPVTELDHLTLRDPSRSPDQDFLYERVMRAERAYLGWRAIIVDTIVGFVVYERQELTPEDMSLYSYPLIPADEIVAAVDRLRPMLQINTEAKIVPTSTSSYDFLVNDRGGFYNSDPSLTRRLRFSDSSTYSASAFLAALLNAAPVTNALLTPLPPIAVLKDHPTVKYPSLALWDRYLVQAKDIWILNGELDALIPSLPLALYAWVTTFRYVVRGGEAVALFGAKSVRATRGAEFFKFVVFVQLCRARRLWEDSEDLFNISVADLREGIVAQFHNTVTVVLRLEVRENQPLRLEFIKEPHSFLEFDVREDDIPKYRAIVQELCRILEQDDRLANNSSLAGVVEGTFRIDDWQ